MCAIHKEKMFVKSDVNIKNRRASFDYEILDRYQAGIVLYGTEIKSIREGHASLVDTYCVFQENGVRSKENGKCKLELWVKQMNIAEYKFGSYANHEARRDRKLLLQKKELRKLNRQVKDTGKTIIPLRLYINEKGLAKMEIGLCVGKHEYDKRASIKERDLQRELRMEER
ncbi:MAG: SsrA-binding protein [Paludibacteraceae bacterium]|nr:SsrA-binding protein [Paludibacteraceae bacterium]